MTTTLYVETNLIIGLARGQDALAERLIRNPPPGVRIALPSVCLMEAITAFESVGRRIQGWIDGAEDAQREVRRDFARSGDLGELLPKLLVGLTGYRVGFRRRFEEWLGLLAERAELIHPSDAVVSGGFENIAPPDLTDTLILRCVLEHAAANPDPNKAFLTDNAKDFDRPGTRKSLADAGVRLFKKTKDFQGWIGSLGR